MSLAHYTMNIEAVLVLNACKEVVKKAENANKQPEEFVTAVYQLDCIMCEYKNLKREE